MSVVHGTEIDGVRCFWVDTGRPTLQASLIFRQGMVDEPLNESGWIHLIEHLALHGRGGGRLGVNGTVGLLTTVFDAHGPVDQVANHLAALTGWLADPAFEGLAHERDVLAAESAMRGGATGRAMAWRYGARGPGICNFDEPGLSRATDTFLAERARAVFTRENAVLVLDGPPPSGLALHLGAGTLLPTPTAIPCDDTLPAMYVDDAGLVMSGVVERSGPAMLVPAVIERMLRTRLRDEAGAAYGPWSNYEPVDVDQAVVFGGSDIGPKLLPTLASEVTGLIDRLDNGGLPPDYVEEATEQFLQSLADPYNAIGIAYRQAMQTLEDRPTESVDELIDLVRSASAESLQPLVQSFTHSLLLGIHGEAKWSDEMPRLEAPLNQPREVGRRFRHRDWPAVVDELYVGDQSIEVAFGDDARAMTFAEIEGMIAFEDGGRYLVTPDGWPLGVEPHDWHDGEVAVHLIDQRVPHDRQLSRPHRRLEPRPRMSATRRWWGGLRRAAVHPVGLVILCSLIAAIAVAVALTGRGAGGFFLGCGIVFWYLIRSYREDRAARAARAAQHSQDL